jgi:membrane-associated phospholipid phosphatase
VTRLRSSGWLLIGYFIYVAGLAPFFMAKPWRTWLLAAVVVIVILAAARANQHVRDWIPLAATLTAYREMNWFTPAIQDHHLERVWIVWDRILLDQYSFRSAIEASGALIPTYLELCYLLVYAVAPLAIMAVIANGKRERVNVVWMAYLAGTLGAYALFPFFPSEPPRTVFAGSDMPHVITFLRRSNLAIVGGYGIHSSVFPSAHVSSAFAAAWGLFYALPEKRWIGWAMAIYALSVAIATIYGRYHYGVDALAGLGVSLLAIPAMRVWRRS